MTADGSLFARVIHNNSQDKLQIQLTEFLPPKRAMFWVEENIFLQKYLYIIPKMVQYPILFVT